MKARSRFRRSKTKGEPTSANDSHGAETKVDFSETLGGYELPSFPVVVAQALRDLADPQIDMASVASVVERDPGATARLLRLVNTASFSPRSKVTSVHQGVMLLGRNQLESLLISIGTHGVLPEPICQGFDKQRFWECAARRAVLARSIAERTDPTRRSENFTAALLQDMAIPVLALRADLYGGVLEHWHNSAEDLASLEEQSFGWHHGMVAGWMGASWEFPAEFVSFLEDHHEEREMDSLLPARVVSPIREVDADGDEQVIEEGGSRLNLGTDEISAMIEESAEEASQLAKLLR